MQSVILIGASGFLGSEVLAGLLSSGYRVFATQNHSILSDLDDTQIIHGGIKGINSKKLLDINPVAIFHCGRPTYSRLRKYGRNLAAIKAKRLNKYLIKQIKKSKLKIPLIFASGSLAYGNSKVAHTEGYPVNPISYSRQYIKGEIPLLMATKNCDFPVMLLRFPWILGNGSWFSWFYLKNINETNSVPVFGDGSNIMSLINVADAANMMIEYFQKNPRSGIYNIFTKDIIPQLEFAKCVADHYGCEVVDYKKIYPGGLESAAMEAFQSNIILDTNYKEILDNYSFSSISESLNHF